MAIGETMTDGIMLSVYGLGMVFASLVSFFVLVLVMRRTMRPSSDVQPAGESGGQGQA